MSSVPLTAQVTGRLTGSVVDPTGAAVPDAEVSLSRQDAGKALLTTKTTADGLFNFTSVDAATYNVTVQGAGFGRSQVNGIRVEPARETSLPSIKLQLSTSAQTIEVSESAQTLQTTSAEVATTVTQAQITTLPVLDRQISNLFLTQAGVTNGRGSTVIDGLRTSYANVTLDGVNIQDNFIRSNGLDYLPNKLTISEVAELTVSTSNANASIGGGAAQIVMITPSGSNTYHGEGYYYNRNSALSANDWFNNKNDVAKPFLNLNQIGGSFGGHLIKDKLFFYLNYEAYRLRQSSPQSNTILTPSARQGILSYKDTTGAIRQFNILQAKGLSIDPAIQAQLNQIPANGNDASLGDNLNTTGYSFNARSNETRDNATGRIDYNLNEANIFSGTYKWNRDIVDRPDIGNFYTAIPPVFNDNGSKFFSLSWRWTVKPTLTNELRGGFNLSPGIFNVAGANPALFINANTYTSPANTFLPQGRDTDTYNFQDNANYVRGNHVLSFGYQMQLIRTNPFNDASIIPTYNLGIPTTSSAGFSAGDIPGLRASDVSTANNLLSDLAGLVSGYNQTFNVNSRTSGFVNGAPNKQRFKYNTYSGYVSDVWKIRPRISLIMGLRYDYYTVLNEVDSLLLAPQLINNNFITTLLSNSQLNFAGNSVGRPYYKPDKNNFAPNFGLAWDVFGTGRTVLRGGYSIAYVNDDTIVAVRNNLVTNNGLSQSVSATNANGRITGALPSIAAPVFQVPINESALYALNSGNAIGLPDPNLRTPYVQQWSFGVQQEVKGFILEARYVGNHATKGLRAFDYNQVIIRENGFLDDFNRARSNGLLAQAGGGAFNPAYNPAIPGSQPLPVFGQLSNANLTNSTVRNNILQGQVGTLGQYYQQNHLNGNVQFFRNPNALGTNTITNYSNSDYNAVQFDIRKRTRAGLQIQGNYTYGKVLSDATGDGQSRFEAFLDIANPQIERARAPYDLTHVFKLNYYLPLPIGPGQRFTFGPVLNRILGGWGTSGFLQYQSGTAFSVFSTRGTLNRGARSINNTANTPLNKGQLDNITGFFQTGNGPMFINPSVINSDGRGVAPDGSPAFSGEAFFNPPAGTLGTLQRRDFSGPWFFNWDASVLKTTKITERQNIEFRADFYNLPNHPAFYAGNEISFPANFNINNTTFGKITSVLNSARVIQFGVHYRF
ncbi:MAG: TonB-dependent receptor [Acidobacteriota bacterium]|nr:TonB-dependent receptor [Acidobacteriota bacterium]